MANSALTSNPPTGLDIHITTHGSDWYWAAFSIFALFALLYTAGALTLRPANERLFFYSSILTTFFLSITYYTLASDLGWTGIPTEFGHIGSVGSVRQIFYARYVGWFLAFIPFFTSISVLAAVPWPTALFTLFAQEVFVVSLLIGSLIRSQYKWGYFVFGVVALIFVAVNLLGPYRFAANTFGGPDVFRTITTVNALTVFLLFLYPICWGLSEGGNVIQPDSEAAFYGVLDISLFIVVGTIFQFFIRELDFSNLGIGGGSQPFFHNKEKLEPTGSTAPAHPATVHPVTVHPVIADPAHPVIADPAVTGPNAGVTNEAAAAQV